MKPQIININIHLVAPSPAQKFVRVATKKTDIQVTNKDYFNVFCSYKIIPKDRIRNVIGVGDKGLEACKYFMLDILKNSGLKLRQDLYEFAPKRLKSIKFIY